MIASPTNRQQQLGRAISLVVFAYTILAIVAVHTKTESSPRTDDAEVFANFIGIAPQVDGVLVKLYVKDNQLVKKGDLLMEIDERPYTYALEQAKSEQWALEGRIEDQAREIAAQNSGIGVSRAQSRNAEASVDKATADIDQARALISNSEAGVRRAEEDLSYATNNLHRLEPLLQEKFVTADLIDQARTNELMKRQALEQAQSQLKLAQASFHSSSAHLSETQATLDQSHEQVEQSKHRVSTLQPLVAERSGRTSAVATAQYNLANTRIYAPFDARVTNLTISEGAYAHTGQQIFTLIDTRTWWVIGNFRETQLSHVQPGMSADVYLMSDAGRAIRGTVESVGFGVTPDQDVIGKLTNGLPDVQRTLNWVHLASRFPVRIRIDSQPYEQLRMGESAMAVIHQAATTSRTR